MNYVPIYHQTYRVNSNLSWVSQTKEAGDGCPVRILNFQGHRFGLQEPLQAIKEGDLEEEYRGWFLH